jgi:uncharacterized protein YkwD
VNPRRRSVIHWGQGIAFALVVAGCVQDQEPVGEPSFYRSMAVPGVEVDASAARSMISAYRQRNGLPAVELDPMLMKMAQDQARDMAAHDRLDHQATRSFKERVEASGLAGSAAAENVGAGYHTLAEAFSGWRDSSSHRANMLMVSATRMGIAAAYAPKSKYKVFWALILARPEAGRS